MRRNGAKVLDQTASGDPAVLAPLVQLLADAFSDDPSLAWDTEALRRQAASPGTIIAVAGDAADPAGVAVVRVAADEAEILTVAVADGMRGRGIGVALLTEAADGARRAGADTLFLEVAADNAPARALYARLGFTEVGRRRHYYRRPGGAAIDALVLSRPIGADSHAGAGPAGRSDRP